MIRYDVFGLDSKFAKEHCTCCIPWPLSANELVYMFLAEAGQG